MTKEEAKKMLEWAFAAQTLGKSKCVIPTWDLIELLDKFLKKDKKS